jgi:TRAP-type C4-dicarboxylate transport system permease small subunit
MPDKLERFEHILKRASSWLNWVAVAAMLLMLLIVTFDVFSSKVFRWPLHGSFDVIGLLAILITALAIPLIQAARGHITIEFLVTQLGKRGKAIVYSIASVFTLILFIVLTWQLFSFSRTIQVAGIITPSVRIPVFYFTYAAAVSFFLVIPLAVVQFLRNIKEVTKK